MELCQQPPLSLIQFRWIGVWTIRPDRTRRGLYCTRIFHQFLSVLGMAFMSGEYSTFFNAERRATYMSSWLAPLW